MGPHALPCSLGQRDNHHHAQQPLSPKPTKLMDTASVAVQRQLKPQTTFSKPFSSAWTISYCFTIAIQTNRGPAAAALRHRSKPEATPLRKQVLKYPKTAMALSEATTEWPSHLQRSNPKALKSTPKTQWCSADAYFQ